MKILHIISSMDPEKGGVSQAVRNIILNNTFAEHEVVCMDDPNAAYDTADDFVIHKTGPGKTSFQYSPAFRKWLEANMGNYTHAVVHGIWQYQNLAAYRARRVLKNKAPRLAIMPHGMLDPYFQKAEGRKIKALRNKIVWALTEKKSINAADALFFTCQEELLLARQTFGGYKPVKELNVGLGVMPPPAQTPQMEQAFVQKTGLQKPYWLFLSRLHPKKGVDLLIKAYKSLSEKEATLPALVIAGPLEGDYARQMQELAAPVKDIVFTGMISGDTKWGAFYGCNAFILPSYQENFGIATVEAMACHKPVAITKHINIWREIYNGKGGLLIEEQTPQAVEATLRQLLSVNGAGQQEAGSNAYATFKDNFDIAHCAKVFVETLKQL